MQYRKLFRISFCAVLSFSSCHPGMKLAWSHGIFSLFRSAKEQLQPQAIENLGFSSHLEHVVSHTIEVLVPCWDIHSACQRREGQPKPNPKNNPDPILPHGQKNTISKPSKHTERGEKCIFFAVIMKMIE